VSLLVRLAAPVLLGTVGLLGSVALSGCDEAADSSAERAAPERSPGRVATTQAPPAQEVVSAGAPLQLAGPRPSVGTPRRATLTIEAIGLRDLAVVPYEGFTDDAPGTVIQDGGVAASPHGPRGGTGPGGVGNYQVTAHRTSSTRAFEFLPRLRLGARVVVETAKRRFVYEIVETRETSFRSARSLARQRAAVPGHPGRTPTEAMITLSTCSTPEDHAEGNFWADEFGNPEHRIDKIGVLVASRPA
jgi:sortase A